jgi:hypothetical protein
VRLKREKDSLVFSLNSPERFLLIRVLRELIEKYRLKPDELDAPTASAWYSTRGCATAGLSAEETQEWLENLHTFKSATLQRLEEWATQLSPRRPRQSAESVVADSALPVPHSALPEKSSLRIKTDHAPTFVTVINDYRLAIAARQAIGQPEMDAHLPWQLIKLPADQQQAVLEIHVLAWIMEETLRLLDKQ